MRNSTAMFDIGFWELAVIAVVALLVIGPERLPSVARTLGLWVGRARRFVVSVKSDIERETRYEELKHIIDQQSSSDAINEIHEIVEETRSTLEKAVEKTRLTETSDTQDKTSETPSAKQSHEQSG